jgi:hypothetical protein
MRRVKDSTAEILYTAIASRIIRKLGLQYGFLHCIGVKKEQVGSGHDSDAQYLSINVIYLQPERRIHHPRQIGLRDVSPCLAHFSVRSYQVRRGCRAIRILLLCWS